MTSDTPLLSVENLTTTFSTDAGLLTAVDDISFDVGRGETVCIVGESGSGKTVASESITRLIPSPPGTVDGTIRFDDRDITAMSESELRGLRGQNIAHIFQNPQDALNHCYTVGWQITEAVQVHEDVADEEARERAVDLLNRVGVANAAARLDDYPHEFSGGQKQRIALARALVVNPEFIVADEPVSALDVSIQAKVIELINDIKDEFGLSMLFISHDMGVIREVCDRVAVMYLGEIVEMAPTEELFENPQHPYTQSLIAAIPNPDPRKRGQGTQLTGDVPSPQNPPSGCRFHTRCPSIIQPEEYEFEQAAWRSVMDYRIRITGDGIEPANIREFVASEEQIDEEAVTEEQMRNAVREEFDVPETLSDPDAESVFVESLDYVFVEEPERAAELLREEFETVCETDAPETVDLSENHAAACHLHTGRGESDVIDPDVVDAAGD